MKKLTQADLDKMVLSALGEGEGEKGKTESKPNALDKLLQIARLKRGQGGTVKGEIK